MDSNLLFLLVAVLAFVAIGGLGFVFVGGQSSQTKGIRRVQAVAGAAKAERANSIKTANDPLARRKQILKSLRDQERQQRKATVTMSARLRQAGLSMSVKTFWMFSAVLGVVAGAIPLVLRLNPLIALGLAFAAGLGLPRWIVGFLGKGRTKKFSEQFSDAIDIIVRGIRSGLPVHDCLKIIARESPEPLAGEFKRLVENIGVGLTVDQALEKMYERMPTPELRFFTIVINIQQKSGGNLAEALSNLSGVLRARKLMRAKIKAMSSEAIASAFIIGCLPPGVIVMVTIAAPDYMKVMFTDPRGHMLLMLGAGMMGFGIFVMRKMINFKF